VSKRVMAVLLALMASGSVAAGRPQGPSGAPAPACSPPMVPHGQGRVATLVAAENAFGFRLYQYLYGHRAQPNVFISPASIALDLDMAYQGARGTTQRGMATALGVGGFRQKAVGNVAGAMLRALRSFDPKVQLEIANSLWVNNGAALQPRFLTSARYHFGAQVANVDLNSPDGPQQINGWVSCATHGTIKHLLDSTSGLLSVLVNTIYFHGLWTTPFNKFQTRPGPFSTNAGQTVRVPFMRQLLGAKYAQGSDYQVIQLPFGQKGRYAMVIVLPRRGRQLAQFAPRITPALWESWTGRLTSAFVDLTLPRFSTTGSYRLRTALSSLGMRQAFSGGANLSGICRGCSISDVIHKTFLQVNETGAVASAATATLLAGGGPQGQRIVTMTVDHPFLLTIEDTHTRAVLFLGGINNPTS
jgi:serine protease inhibitor